MEKRGRPQEQKTNLKSCELESQGSDAAEFNNNLSLKKKTKKKILTDRLQR